MTVIGYSMGGGECARYMSRHGGKGVVKLGLYASVVPGMLKTDDNPAGHTEQDYRGIVAGIEKDARRLLPPHLPAALSTARASSRRSACSLLGQRRRDRGRRRHVALMGSMRAQTAMPHNFTFGDFTGDIPAITVPTLILHGTEDKPAPIDAAARRAQKMIPGSRLIEYEGHPHGFYATNSDGMIADTLAFLRQ